MTSAQKKDLIVLSPGFSLMYDCPYVPFDFLKGRRGGYAV